ncbi:hypothetical protein [Alkalinema sp. FACHB-956]|uniref:hypothetical protein n=1 Tax=Alkalinema sp. FACHB-956 TaxID=2692768 RepID=UPI001686FEA0|nr:hypothetical protein [Alkalinema sp. FACHB-956]MBD2327323.1 hypothetical protein [Alkalinema sp. FACHB-956]
MADRIQQIEKNLKLLYAQLGAAEEGAIMAQSTVAKTKYEQEIETDLKPKIRQFEQELFTLLQQESAGLIFGEAEAQATIEVIAQEVKQLQGQPDLDEEMLGLLRRIEAKLNEPGVTADAKLKGTLSIFPPFIGLSYEAQLDTENFCRKYFPTFTRLLKGAKKL